MNIRALFLDLDGTLLTSRRTVSPRTEKRLLQFQQEGGRIVLCSARPYAGMREYGHLLRLAEHSGFYAAFGGAVIVNAADGEQYSVSGFSDSEVRGIIRAVSETEDRFLIPALAGIPPAAQSPLTLSAARAVYDLVGRNSINVMTYQDDTLIARRMDPYAALESAANRLQLFIPRDFTAAACISPVKFLVSADPGIMKEAAAVLQEKLPQHEVTTSDPYFTEITPQGVSKGHALLQIAEIMGIPAAETAAVGDSRNDLSMMRAAGISAAMANASEEIRKEAGCTVPSNDEDGIAVFLDRIS